MRVAARKAAAAAMLIAAFLPASARACPVCFGNDAGPLTQGARAAAFVLLGLSASVLAAVGAFIYRLYRRGRAAAADAPGTEGATPGWPA